MKREYSLEERDKMERKSNRKAEYITELQCIICPVLACYLFRKEFWYLLERDTVLSKVFFYGLAAVLLLLIIHFGYNAIIHFEHYSWLVRKHGKED